MSARPRAVTGAFAWVAFAVVILLAPCLVSGPAAASIRHHHWLGGGTWGTPTDPDKDAALVVDGATGKTLYARNADALRHPASLTKMMTLYLLFEQLKSGQMTLATPLMVSEHAASQHPTKLHVRPGNSVPVDTAIKAIVVLSANDVAVAIAEAIGGTEEHFAEMMTAKAHEFGMDHTFYHNASGLPDEAQVTTAHDLALLAHHLAYDFPQYFPYFATPSFGYRGGYYVTHDNLIGNYDGADGIKTGYTQASGFNLVSSVVRGGAHVIGVVMGGRSAHRRDGEMIRLLNDTFAQIEQNPRLVARANVPWQTIAENTRSGPVIAGFQIGGAGVQPQQAAATHATGTPADPDDEDAAESRPDTDDGQATPNTNVIAAVPVPTPNVAAAQPAIPAAVPPALRSSTGLPALSMANVIHLVPPKPIPTPRPAPLVLASYQPQSRPLVTPRARAEALGEGDIGDVIEHVARTPAKIVATNPTPAALGDRDWTIQIGAFVDMTSAKAQLASYAERSMDVLGQADRVVVPFKSVEGQTLFRARFGPFVEREAREVCERLTERGQTCFAALAQR
ncbi:MAG: D-alanyl-D-alanine carboxypeptidase [Rhizomicrobium sp.]|jgi:D-alanyl-D-alanine carboxypeptidase